MLKSPFVLAAMFVVLGNSGVWAESTNPNHKESLRMVTFQDLSVTERDGVTHQEKLDLLQSKLQELEAQMKQLLPEASLQGQASKNIPYDSHTVKVMQGWSSTDHLREANVSEQNMVSVEEKLQKIQSRLDRLAAKPYLDTKGFKRSGLKTLKGRLTQKLHEARQKIAWHRSQAQTIMSSKSHQPQSS